VSIVKEFINKLEMVIIQEMGWIDVPFCRMSWCCGLYLSWLSMKMFVFSRLKTELMIHLA
jgi:hypothetical protein